MFEILFAVGMIVSMWGIIAAITTDDKWWLLLFVTIVAISVTGYIITLIP